MGVFAAITARVGAVVALPAGGALPLFRAFTYDPSTYELLSYHSGEGDVETDRVAVENVPDNEGFYVEVPTLTIGYAGARYDGGVAYADDGSGVLVDPQPFAVIAPEATNECKKSNNLTSFWLAQGGCSTVRDEVGIDGAANIATTLSCADATNARVQMSAVGDFNGTTDYASVRMWCKPGSNPLAYAATGTKNSVEILFNPTTKALGNIGAGIEPGSVLIKEDGDWLVVTAQSVAGNQPVGPQVIPVYPARNEDGGVNGIPTTGSLIVGQIEIYKNVPVDVVRSLPPLYTTSVATLRDKDEVFIDSANVLDPEGMIYFELIPGGDTSNLVGEFLKLENGFVVLDDGEYATVAAALVDTGAVSYIGVEWGPAGMRVCANGTWSQLVPHEGTLLALDPIPLFKDALYTGQIRELQIWDAVDSSIIDGLMPAAEVFGAVSAIVVKTASANEDFTITAWDDGVYDATVDWGDGTPDSSITAYNDAALTHTYEFAGNHVIKVSGEFTGYYFALGVTKDKITGILHSGNTSMRRWDSSFGSCSELIVANLNGGIGLTTTSLSVTLYNLPKLWSFTIEGCQLGNVTTLSSFIRNGRVVTNIDFTGHDLRNVVNVSRSFNSASRVKNITCPGNAEAILTTANSLVGACFVLTKLDLSAFSFKTVANLYGVYEECRVLEEIDIRAIGEGFAATTFQRVVNKAYLIPTAKLDAVLQMMYENRALFTGATLELDLSTITASPSGVYQDATPPTTGEEYRYKLNNDPDGEGFNTWNITI